MHILKLYIATVSSLTVSVLSLRRSGAYKKYGQMDRVIPIYPQ